jgi:hypothetical protein
MWQLIASSSPPPKAKPLTAAITGLENFSIKLNNDSCPFLAKSSPSFLEKLANSLISAPATNALFPSPLKITSFNCFVCFYFF